MAGSDSVGQGDQRTIVNDVVVRIFAGDRRLHAVVEDLERNAANGGEGQHVTAQQRLQVLVHDELRKNVAGVAKHE